MPDQPMSFRAYGRSLHLRISTPDDLQAAVELDEAHWVATNAPISTIHAEPALLALLDTDGNGRITAREVKSAIRWTLDLLADRSGLTDGRRTLRVADIRAEADGGRLIRDSLRKILSRNGRDDTEAVSVDEVLSIKSQIESQPVSEAGVVLPTAADDEPIRRFLEDITSSTGGAPHPGGKSGVSQAQLDSFLAAAEAHLDWLARGRLAEGESRSDVLPLGAATADAFAALQAVRAKLDQYFAQCEAAATDPRFVQRMGWTDQDLAELNFNDPQVIRDVLAKAPLAPAEADRRLDLSRPINPYWAAALDRMVQAAAAPLLGVTPVELASAQWQQVKDSFAAHEAWLAAKAGCEVEPVGEDRLREYLEPRYASAVRDLIATSAQTAYVLDTIRLVERLGLYQANLMELANNFVSFPRLYDPGARASFEMGTLVMDGRRFSLAVLCENRAEHAKVAATSSMYLLYVQVTCRGAQGPRYEVAVPVTSGGKGNLCIGKRGVFYDVQGRECDAVVVQILDNPISLREAVAAPFVRLGKLLSGKIESLTAEAEQKFDARASTAMSQVAPGPGAPPAPVAPAPQQQPQGNRMATGGLVMGAGVAVAALGSALAYVTKTLAETSWWAILFTVLGAVLVVLIPTSIVALLKLRRRDLSAILEGSGWGINARMRLTRTQRHHFTNRPPFPPGSKGTRSLLLRNLLIVIIVIALLAAGAAVGRHLIKQSQQQTPVTAPNTPPAPPKQ